jgi:hypothetical protein
VRSLLALKQNGQDLSTMPMSGNGIFLLQRWDELILAIERWLSNSAYVQFHNFEC